jgi:hypothetical protein
MSKSADDPYPYLINQLFCNYIHIILFTLDVFNSRENNYLTSVSE